MRYIYLDQNKWILLAKKWYERKGEGYDLVCELKKKIESKEVMVVVSLMNLKETLKRVDEGSRNRLLEFIFELSKGNTISPFRDWVIDDEVENLFLERLGKRINIRSKVIRKGISGIIGMEASLEGDFSDKVKAEMIAKVNSIEIFKTIFSTLESTIQARESSDYIKKETSRFEDVRRKERFQKDKRIQFETVLKNFFREFILERGIRFFVDYNFSIFRKDMSIKDLEDLMKKLPATYSYFSLTDLRDRDLSKMIEDNDLYDLFGFTMGVSYCDILFGEKRFVALSRQAKLDELYGTIITSSLEEFKKAIS